jgi:hypothetical protein
LRFYIAHITRPFLAKFGYPVSRRMPINTTGSAAPASLVIQYKRVLYKPYSTLRRRLLDDILPPPLVLDSVPGDENGDQELELELEQEQEPISEP